MKRMAAGSLLIAFASLTNCSISGMTEHNPTDGGAGAAGHAADGLGGSGLDTGGRSSTTRPIEAGVPSLTSGGAPGEPAAVAAGAGAGGDAGAQAAAGSAGEPSEPQPSCVGLTPTCGADDDDNCCAAALVPAGKFNRSSDAASPATLSAFRLDNYEVTVGRFRRFVAAYTQDMIAEGAGSNPNDAADTGWDIAWNGKLPKDAAALKQSLLCDQTQPVPSDAPYNTWQGGNDNRPINCVDWYVASAFCAWDGGRLPTEAEWNYAAAGGNEQRTRPWGEAPLGQDATLAAYGCYYGSNGTCIGVANIAPVGSIPAGHAKWGQLDMLGNLWEWTRDAYADPYAKPCVDCAALGTGGDRTYRGGGFVDNAQTTTALRGHAVNHASHNIGIRCARAAE